MGKNYFELICELVSQNPAMNKYEFDKKKERMSIKDKDLLYEIIYDAPKKKVSLTDGKSKVLASWLLNEETSTQKDAEMICKDFVETITGPSLPTFKASAKKKSAGDESNVTGLFFANRMAGVFSDIKEEILEEKECYSEFRTAKFTRESILPRINTLLDENKDKSMIKKLGKLLSELYQNGTKDVRSVITMVILNGIKDNKCGDTLKQVITEELKKAWVCALKYKNKNVRPEKVKKKSSLMTKALEYQKEQENIRGK